jgi:hypothetical protein
MKTFIYSSRLVAMLLGIFPALAIAEPPFATDDPATTGPGEVTLLVGYEGIRNGGSREHNLPIINLTFGLGPRMDFTLAGGALRLDGPEDRFQSVHDTFANFKYRFQDEDGGRPALAVAYEIKIPTGRPTVGIGTPGYDHTLYLTGARSLGGLELQAHAGATTGERETSLFYAAALIHQPSQRLRIGVEMTGNTGSRTRFEEDVAAAIGASYWPNENVGVMVRAARSLRGQYEFAGFVGVEWTFATRR